MERMTKRLENGHYAMVGNGTPTEKFLKIPQIIKRLAAYEDTGLEPEEIVPETIGCVFYANRRCNLDGDFCPEGPGCPHELMPEAALQMLMERA